MFSCTDETTQTETETNGELEEEVISGRPAVAEYPAIISTTDELDYDGLLTVHVMLNEVNGPNTPKVIDFITLTTATLPLSFTFPISVYNVRDAHFYSITAYVTNSQGHVIAWTQNPIPALTHGLDAEVLEISVYDVDNHQDSTVYTFECDNGSIFTASYWGEDVVRLMASDNNYLLRQTESASGARFTSREAEFWNKGTEATITIGDDTLSCTQNNMLNVKAESMLKGAAFRATGNEPGWLVEIFESEEELIGLIRLNYGQEIILTTSNEPGIFSFSHHGKEIRLDVTEETCMDTMADQQFEFSAVLTVDSDTFRGCGSGF